MVDINNLLSLPESDNLDFKREWHSNNVSLLHDILCMANSDSNQDRYLVIGFDESTKKIKSVTKDPNRKNTEKLIDLLKNSNFNVIPTVYIKSQKVKNKILDVIVIEKTKYRPFFLTKDKQFQGKTIRSGVIYTRTGPTNTPKDGSASEYQIADMWRERFGLNLSPMERMQIYLKDYENWKKQPLEYGVGDFYYYNPFPEFTITTRDIAHIENIGFEEEWAEHFPDKERYTQTVYLKYHTTILDRKEMATLDGCRYNVFFPERVCIFDDNKGNISAHRGFSQNLKDEDFILFMFYKKTDSMSYDLDIIFNNRPSEFYKYFNNPFIKIHLFDETISEDEIHKELCEIYQKNKKKGKIKILKHCI